jgi:hypothetical protein
MISSKRGRDGREGEEEREAGGGGEKKETPIRTMEQNASRFLDFLFAFACLELSLVARRRALAMALAARALRVSPPEIA